MPSKKDALKAVMNDEDMFNQTAFRAFSSVDVDGSGQLDKTEMKACLAAFNKDFDAPSPSDERVEQYISILDEGDGDGLVSLEEFKVLLKAMMNVTIEMMDD
mmetsp:Transcript_17480/g.19656  ORF Transcript_17480/g.19656 Transcript_17480/m.19656 type:complete len:102 (+) Transcript_17480:27-332(+)|eukprot:CAMPEP_0205812244 /NCGR_PEP_ID=MMETSP0205-20121125/16639_1 /ASSEMBLY_ACC=CAM_ASM_000278 /TAXON_ID=36767 /ORGANISM="Euplotes focardii, Strain TN1" /LENGTH=101 /DNA_ID=CAMNT_0053092611 /DNA_START=18 /DNA_END=323 /DNA_ORIENTATION=+